MKLIKRPQHAGNASRIGNRWKVFALGRRDSPYQRLHRIALCVALCDGVAEYPAYLAANLVRGISHAAAIDTPQHGQHFGGFDLIDWASTQLRENIMHQSG